MGGSWLLGRWVRWRHLAVVRVFSELRWYFGRAICTQYHYSDVILWMSETEFRFSIEHPEFMKMSVRKPWFSTCVRAT